MELLLLIGILIIIFLTALNWKLSVKAVLVILVIEGVLRKWVLPQASELIYFFKDLVIIGAYTGFFIFNFSKEKFKKYPKNSGINVLIFFTSAWCLFQAFNPSLGSPLAGIFGLKGYLLYIPMMWVIPRLFETEEELYLFLRNYLLLVIPVCILGIVQFYSPVDSPVNLYIPTEEGKKVFIAGFGGKFNHARVTGTFSYISGYSSYLVVCFSWLIVLILKEKKKLWSMIYGVQILLVITNSFMTGARAVVFANVLFLALYIFTQAIKRPKFVFSFIGKFLFPSLIAVSVMLIYLQPAIDAFLYRANNSDKASQRVNDAFSQEYYTYNKGLDGYGTGATHQATPTLRRVLNLPPGETLPFYNEGETARIYLELGPIGFVLWYTLRLAIIYKLFSLFFKLKRSLLRNLALAASITQLTQITLTLVFQHTFLPQYWFLSSFIFVLPRLQQIETTHQVESMAPHAPSSYFPNTSHW